MDSEIFLNSSLPLALEGIKDSEIPDFLQKKRGSESVAIEEFEGELGGQLPYREEMEYRKLVSGLSAFALQFGS